jgi:ABC-2 type transport system permease protein
MAPFVFAIRKYIAITYINYLSRFAYIPDMLSELPIMLFRLWVSSQFYAVTYSVTNTAEFDGLSFPQLMWLLMFVNCFESSSTQPDLSKMIEDEVKSGTLAYSINKPYSYPWFHYAGYLGRTVPNLLINLIGGICLMYLLVSPVQMSLKGLLAGALLMVFGFTLHFLIDLCIGLLAFWIEDVGSIAYLYHTATLIFGGVILPLSLFPTALKRIAELLPFGQLYYSGARLMVEFEASHFFSFLQVQVFWLVVFFLLSLLIWRKGMKNVSISGG